MATGKALRRSVKGRMERRDWRFSRDTAQTASRTKVRPAKTKGPSPTLSPTTSTRCATGQEEGDQTTLYRLPIHRMRVPGIRSPYENIGPLIEAGTGRSCALGFKRNSSASPVFTRHGPSGCILVHETCPGRRPIRPGHFFPARPSGDAGATASDVLPSQRRRARLPTCPIRRLC